MSPDRARRRQRAATPPRRDSSGSESKNDSEEQESGARTQLMWHPRAVAQRRRVWFGLWRAAWSIRTSASALHASTVVHDASSSSAAAARCVRALRRGAAAPRGLVRRSGGARSAWAATANPQSRASSSIVSAVQDRCCKVAALSQQRGASSAHASSGGRQGCSCATPCGCQHALGAPEHEHNSGQLDTHSGNAHRSRQRSQNHEARHHRRAHPRARGRRPPDAAGRPARAARRWRRGGRRAAVCKCRDDFRPVARGRAASKRG